MAFRIFSFACSDVGRKREHNEDRYAVARDLNLFLVADGMGGYSGGEVASDMAVRIIQEQLRAEAPTAHDSEATAARRFEDAVRKAGRAIHDRAQEEPALARMGTTATGVLVHDRRALVAHVGDSRCYLLRGERIHLLSEDHSVVFQQRKAGLISEEEALRSPFRNVITRAVGVEADVEVDLFAVELRSGDALLLCSDGLSGLVSDDEINLLVTQTYLHRVPERLVDLANERGGPDNVTVVLAYFLDEAELPSGASRTSP